MDRITNIEQLNSLLVYIRNLRTGYVTNFYFDETKHSTWIEANLLTYNKWEDTVFLFYENSFCKEECITNLYYISTSEEYVTHHLQECKVLYPNVSFIIDIVGRDNKCLTVVDDFKSIGAEHLTTLQRMIRLDLPENYDLDDKVVLADIKDISIVDDLLCKNFDVQIEQLPLRSELIGMINQGHVLKYMNNEEIAGLLLFDLNSTTLHLRYLLTLPNYRNKGVGSALCKRCFKEGSTTKRQILWVRQENSNAIVRYQHIGFVEENMYDYILKY